MKMYMWNHLDNLKKRKVLMRPFISIDKKLKLKVKKIIEKVKNNGDQSIIELTEKFDGVVVKNLKVTQKEIQLALKNISPQMINAMQFAKKQLESNHFKQVPKNQTIETSKNVFCKREYRPIEKIGLYIPGGSAPLLSTVLMLGIPSKIAKCPIRVICTPPNKKGKIDPYLLFAAKLCGIESIYKIGGAQAIAAMAYGTESVPKVDKIFGPGNNWVTQAKIQMLEDPNAAGIDMPAGPSELMIIADEKADLTFIAADLLSQAEHGEDSQVMLITLSQNTALNVITEIKKQIGKLSRQKIIKKSLQNSRVIIVKNIHQAIEVCNLYAPEHLIMQVQQAKQYIKKIKNAGAVFLGKWTPETVGDYVTGSNHVLPTYGYSKYLSGLGVMDFMKWISFQDVKKSGLNIIGPYAEILAEAENLDAHKQAVSIRLKKKVNL